MPYQSEGTLTTDIREVAIDTTWDSQSDWEAYQSAQNVQINSGVVSLAQSTVFEDFEDGDVSEYSGTNLGNFSTVTSPVYEGTYAGRIDTGDTDVRAIKSTPSFSQGQQMDGRIRIDSGINARFLFAAQSANTWHAIQLNLDQNAFRIRLSENDSLTTLAEEIVTIPSGEYLYPVTRWYTDGTIEADLFDSGTQIASISHPSSTWSSGQAGFAGYSTVSYFDSFRITNL